MRFSAAAEGGAGSGFFAIRGDGGVVAVACAALHVHRGDEVDDIGDGTKDDMVSNEKAHVTVDCTTCAAEACASLPVFSRPPPVVVT